ncbi:MAG TPA: DUF3472 domain-containing protein [Flavisolibacter sp.]|nr:DUF3472 domain-containing protein [Flavisolibacter sp.]
MKSGKGAIIALVIYSALNASFNSVQHYPKWYAGTDSTILLPLGENTWCTKALEDSNYITREGIKNWKDEKVGFDTYLRVTDTGSLKIQLKARSNGTSRLKLEINGKVNTFVIQSSDYSWYDAGEWKINDTGYIKLHLSALSKTGSLVSEVSDYRISGTAINGRTAFVKNDSDNYFYWGRRGPSVHLNYPFADSINAAWFYNEVTVPKNQDVIGSYFMAIGFSDGYFGIQVNSKTERRILFSVWSPYHTDDPNSIPQDMRIRLLKKGHNVQAGEFGNEGAGGQSFLRYSWKANTKYKFLVHGQPDDQNNTRYTAYFFDPLINQWRLIASFQRPKTNHYLTRFHSFLENFLPEKGNETRMVFFNNQWIAGKNGQWQELTAAHFTFDNTARKGYRMDFAGGRVKGSFYLKNCGFFNQYTSYNSVFQRPPTSIAPRIAFEKLP